MKLKSQKKTSKNAQHKIINPPDLQQQLSSVFKEQFATLDVLFFRAD